MLVDAVEIVVVVVFEKSSSTTRVEDDLYIQLPHTYAIAQMAKCDKTYVRAHLFSEWFLSFPVSFVLFVLGIRHMMNAFTFRGMYLDCNTHKNQLGDNGGMESTL